MQGYTNGLCSPVSCVRNGTCGGLGEKGKRKIRSDSFSGLLPGSATGTLGTPRSEIHNKF